MKIELGGHQVDLSNCKNVSKYMKALDTVKELINDNFDYLQVIDAKMRTGVGKSTLALFSAMYVDEGFTLNQLAFDNLKDIFKKIRHAKPGDAVILDEGGAALFSRDFAKKEIKLFVKALMIARAKRIYLIVVLPSVMFLDKYVRLSLGSLVGIRRRGRADFYTSDELIKAWGRSVLDYTIREYKPYRPVPLFTFGWPRLDNHPIYHEYIQKKENYIDERLDTYIMALEAEEEIEYFDPLKKFREKLRYLPKIPYSEWKKMEDKDVKLHSIITTADLFYIWQGALDEGLKVNIKKYKKDMRLWKVGDKYEWFWGFPLKILEVLLTSSPP